MTQTLLKLEGIESSYGAVKAVRGVSLQVQSGEICSILGSNGAGKTTVLKTVSGILDPEKGSVQFNGKEISGQDPATIVQMGLLHVPEGREVFPHLSVYDNLSMGAFTRRDRAEVGNDIEEVFGYFPILRQRSRIAAGLLSGGQQQMLALSRAIVARPKMILLDEPSLGLSPKLTQEIFEIVVQINRKHGTAFLVVEQNANMALNVADYSYILENGRLVTEGASSGLRQRKDIQSFYLGVQDPERRTQPTTRSLGAEWR
ncbi:MAG: ABC transporter ATP-binding protein [Devosia sp.]